MRPWMMIAAAAFFGIGMNSASAAGVADLKFAFDDAQILLQPGAQEGKGAILLDLSGVDAATSQVVLQDLKDLDLPSLPAVEVKFDPRELPADVNGRHWIVGVEVKGLTSAATQKRFVTFQFASRTFTLPYTLSNVSTKTFSWSVTGPASEISLRPDQGVEIGISVGDVPATNVRLIQSTFIEQSTKTTVGDGWELCQEPNGSKCTASDLIPADTSRRMWLRPKDQASVVGSFNGTVVIGSSEKPAGETLSIVISGTSAYLQWLGAGAILVGVALAWLVNNLLQGWTNRAELALPLKALAERVDEIDQRLDRMPENLKGHTNSTRRALSDLRKQLTIDSPALAGLLPRTIPNPFQTAVASLDGYTRFLAAGSDKVAWLQVLVSKGFEELSSAIERHATVAVMQAAASAADDLDALSTKDAPPLPDAMVDIAPILNGFRAEQAKIKGLLLESVASGFPPPVRKVMSYEQLTVKIRQVSLLVWGIFVVVSTALGSYLIILNDSAFGLTTDFLLCFFWGFGLPIAAQQLSLSTASVATVMGISIPARRGS